MKNAIKNNSNIGYIKEGLNLKTVYTIEFINNEHDFNLLDKHPAPWELYKTKTTENLQEAIEIFTKFYANMNAEQHYIYDVKLFESILLNDEIVREQYITDITGFVQIAGREANRIHDKNKQLEYNTEQSNKKLDTFLKKYNAFKLWQDLNIN